MNISSSGQVESFDDVSFVKDMEKGQWLRFDSMNNIDNYHKIESVNISAKTASISSVALTGSNYTDVEHGLYCSDWREENSETGVSQQCESSRIHTTLPIDVTTELKLVSSHDWSKKIGAVSVIDSTGIQVSRELLQNLSLFVGFVWKVTFLKQPRKVNEIVCHSLSGQNNCNVSTIQESSITSGMFKLGTTWPHEYEL